MVKESFFSAKGIFSDRRKLSVFVICVVLSAIMWLLISLGKTYNNTVIIPVRYSNLPENKTLINEVPTYLVVNVSGTGYSLLRYDKKFEDTLEINLAYLRIDNAGRFQKGYLDFSRLSRQLQQRLQSSLTVNRVLTDTIVFVFDQEISRHVKVRPNIEFSIEDGYVLLDSISVSPSEVMVTGPESVLDTLQYIPTGLVRATAVNKTTYFKASLAPDEIGKNAFSETDSVTIVLEVDQLTEKQFMIFPVHQNVPDSLTMLTFPNGVELTAQVPMSRFDQVSEKDFTVILDYNDMEKGYPVLPAKLDRWPAMVKRVSVKPQQVEIVLSRKKR